MFEKKYGKNLYKFRVDLKIHVWKKMWQKSILILSRLKNSCLKKNSQKSI